MKKVFLIVALVAVFVSCGKKASTETKVDSISIKDSMKMDSIAKVDSIKLDSIKK